MSRKPTIKQYLNAIDGSMGFINTIANRSGVSWHTAKNKIEGNKKLKKAYEEELEKKLDFGETQLMKNIKEGKETSVIFFLKTKGKQRGYVEKQELEHSGDIERSVTVNVENLNKDELEALSKLKISNESQQSNDT